MFEERAGSLSIPLAGVDEILAAVRKQMLFASDVVLSGGRDCGFPGVDIQTVLTFLGKAYGEGDHVVIGNGMRHVLG